MADESRGGMKWLKYGCGCCLGVVLLGAIGVGSILLVARGQAGDAEMTTRQEEIPLPAAAGDPIDAGVIGRFELELTQAGVEVRPAPAGTPLTVDATFDENGYRLIREFEEGADGGPPTYRVRFKGTSAPWMMMLRRLMGGEESKLVVHVPTDAVLDMKVRLVDGGMDADFGGTSLSSLEMDMVRGGAVVDFSEPVRAPMRRLAIGGAMGGLAAKSLGNASPRELDVGFSMGGGDFDLRGQWLNDADVKIDFSRGGGRVRLPRDVTVQGLSGFRGAEEFDAIDTTPREVPLPVLRFDVTVSDKNDLEFQR